MDASGPPWYPVGPRSLWFSRSQQGGERPPSLPPTPLPGLFRLTWLRAGLQHLRSARCTVSPSLVSSLNRLLLTRVGSAMRLCRSLWFLEVRGGQRKSPNCPSGPEYSLEGLTLKLKL